MSERSTIDGFHELLRNSAPGYIFVLLLIPPLGKVLKAQYGNSFLVAMFVVGGPIIGLLLFNIYHLVHANIIWRFRLIRNLYNLKHITVLLGKFCSHGQSHGNMRALWDSVFFSASGPVADRIVFLTSRGHFWGTIFLGLLIAIPIWIIFGGFYAQTTYILILVVFLIGAFVSHYWTIRQAAALEYRFLLSNLNQLISEDEWCRQVERQAISEVDFESKSNENSIPHGRHSTASILSREGDDRRNNFTNRIDDSFKVLLILGPIFLALVWIHPGITPDRYQILVAFLALAIITWVIGYALADHVYAVQLKLTGWLIWLTCITFLAIFSIWIPFLNFALSNLMIVRVFAGIISFATVVSMWHVLRGVYPLQRREIAWISILIGVVVTLLFPCLTIR